MIWVTSSVIHYLLFFYFNVYLWVWVFFKLARLNLLVREATKKHRAVREYGGGSGGGGPAMYSKIIKNLLVVVLIIIIIIYSKNSDSNINSNNKYINIIIIIIIIATDITITMVNLK